jgi:hypothetical protein
MPVTMRDLTQILDAVRTVNEADDAAFERTMLTAAADLIACDTVSYNEHHLERGRGARVRRRAELPGTQPGPAALPAPPRPPSAGAACASGRLVTGDCASLSDLMTPREFRNLPIYTDYFRHREVADQLVAVLKARDARTSLLVSAGPGAASATATARCSSCCCRTCSTRCGTAAGSPR